MRLNVIAQSTEEVVLAVDGWVGGDDVGLLALEASTWLAQSRRLVLELGQLRGIDPPGIELLRTWPADRLVLRHGSPFVTALLAAYGLDVSAAERG